MCNVASEAAALHKEVSELNTKITELQQDNNKLNEVIAIIERGNPELKTKIERLKSGRESLYNYLRLNFISGQTIESLTKFTYPEYDQLWT